MQNSFFMQQAIEEALKADPNKVYPNPLVGCVIVKNDKEKKKELLFLKNRQIKKNTEKDISKLNLKVIKDDQKQNKTKQNKHNRME